MHRHRLTFSVLLFLLFQFVPVSVRPVFAETDEPPIDQAAITRIVVTATRDERDAKDVPNSLSILNADKIRIQTPARTVPEALKALPGTMVQKTGHGQGSPYIRGFTGYRNLFLIDGIRLNNSVFRDGPNQYWNTVDPFSIHRLEVIRGPFSMLYGSDAIGGMVNVITRGVKDLTPDRKWDRHLYYRYASAENASITRAESIAKITDDLAVTVGYSLKDFHNLEGGRDVGTQNKTGYDEDDWDIKLEYFHGNNGHLVIAHQGVRIDDAWRTHKTIYGIDWEGLTRGKELRRSLDQERYLTYIQYHYNGPLGFADEIHAGISHHQQSEERDRLRTGSRHDIQGLDVITTGAFLTLQSQSYIGRLTYGVEFYLDAVDSFKHSLNPDGTVKSTAIQGPVGDDAAYDLLGFYLQDEFTLSDKLSLIVGGRYETASADADKVEDPATGNVISVSGDWDNIAGSVRMKYAVTANKSCFFFSGVSQGFRAPNLSDLTRLDTARTNEIETPTPDLDPEHFTSFEIGFKTQTKTLSAGLSYYYTDIDGMIIRTPTGLVIDGDFEVTKKNAGDGFVKGFEFDAKYRFWRDASIFGMFSWMDGEVETYPTSDSPAVTEPIDRLMPPWGRFGMRWDQDGEFWAEAACTVSAKADKLSTRDKADTSRIPPGGTPGYTVYDLRGGFQWTERLIISISIENIFNKDYRIHGSGVNEPGRNIVFAGNLTL